MSTTAVSWALYDAPAGDPTARLILTHLAEHADRDGRGAYPSVPTIAEDVEVSVRTVRRHLDSLEGRGLIRRGDQQLVSHYPADRRPVVWDLNLSTRRERGDKKSPRSGRPPQERGDSHVIPPDGNGVTPVTERGDTGDQNGVTPVSPKPSTQTILTPTESNRQSHASAREDTHMITAVGGVAPPTETRQRPRRKSRIPEDLALTENRRQYAISKGIPPGVIDEMFEHFKNHHLGKGTEWVDWNRAWMTWVLNAPKYRNVTSIGRPRPMTQAERNADIMARARARLADQQPTQMAMYPTVIEGEPA